MKSKSSLNFETPEGADNAHNGLVNRLKDSQSKKITTVTELTD